MDKEYLYKYIALASKILLALIVVLIPFFGIEKTLKESKIRSETMAVYERIVSEPDNYNKLDLLLYLQSLDKGNTAITSHINRIQDRIETINVTITEKNQEIIQLQQSLEELQLNEDYNTRDKVSLEQKIAELENEVVNYQTYLNNRSQTYRNLYTSIENLLDSRMEEILNQLELDRETQIKLHRLLIQQRYDLSKLMIAEGPFIPSDSMFTIKNRHYENFQQ